MVELSVRTEALLKSIEDIVSILILRLGHDVCVDKE